MNGNNYTLEIVATFIVSLLIGVFLLNYVIMPNQKNKMAEFNKVVKEITGVSSGTISTNIIVPTIKQ
jgi:tellurite resistance protein TehA-like permease